MKRVLSLLLLIFFIPVNCSASSVKSTEKRGVIEFIELFTKRLYEYSAYEKSEIDLTLSKQPLIQLENSVLINFSAGILEVDKETFDLLSVMTTYHAEFDSDQEAEENIVKLFSVISALEYSILDEKLLDTQNSINRYFDREETNVFNEVVKINKRILSKISEGNNRSKLLDLNEKIFVYSGNYDYYLSYSENETASGKMMKTVYLFAEAR